MFTGTAVRRATKTKQRVPERYWEYTPSPQILQKFMDHRMLV
jgi:hypothetical protein